MNASSGPHLQMAVLCEKVLQERDGVLSIIRVVDGLTQTATGTEPPQQMPPILLSTLTLVIVLKAGEARGRYAIKIVAEDPSGVRALLTEIAIQLEGGARGVNLIAPLSYAAPYEGTYWFDIYFVAAADKEDLLTRVPLQIHYQPQRVPPS